MEERKEIQCPPEFGGPSTPWLIYPNAPSMKSHTFCNILEPNNNCIKRIPEMRRRLCKESSHGWLVMLDLSPGDGNGCSLWNPVTLETIHLPDLKLEDDDDFDLMSCTLSSAPTNPSCMVLFFLQSNPVIIYCQPGDAQWTRQSFEIEDGGITHAVGFCDGTIYASTNQDNTVIIRRDSSGRLSLRPLNVKRPKDPPRTRRIHTFSFESCGELFRVYMSFSGTDALNCITVFKMDFSQMVWVKAEVLGGRVFFLSFDGISCVSCSADLQSGLEGDCIYFNLLEGDKTVYVFDMKDDSISVCLPCPDLHGPWCSPFWFIPIRNSIAEQTNSDEGRTVAANKKMYVKETEQEILMEDGNVQMECSIFSSLPNELQYSIATHLTSAVDYMNFRAVCKTCRSVAPPIRWKSPWLIVVQKGVSFFLDPECNSIYRMNTPELFGATICFSKDGWLLMSDGNLSVFFFNPFTKARIEVPDMTYYYCFDGICFSSLPTSSDCVIFGIGLLGPSAYTVGWYRLGQEEWSYEIIYASEQEPFPLSCSNPVYYDGAFYCLSHEGRLGVFDVNEKWTVLLNSQPCSTTSQNFMVECDGELLSVFIDDGGNSTIVSKLDRTMMDWVRVNSLSDRTLFLSPATSIAIETQEKKLQNKIFLPRVWNKKNNDVVFYSLETEKYHSFSSSSFSRNDFYGTKVQLYCSWIQPNLLWRNIS